jgi:hypothetical protein
MSQLELLLLANLFKTFKPFERFKVDSSSRSFPRSGNPGSFVTPVKTGVRPHNLDTVLQRYDGRCPSHACRWSLAEGWHEELSPLLKASDFQPSPRETVTRQVNQIGSLAIYQRNVVRE